MFLFHSPHWHYKHIQLYTLLFYIGHFKWRSKFILKFRLNYFVLHQSHVDCKIAYPVSRTFLQIILPHSVSLVNTKWCLSKKITKKWFRPPSMTFKVLWGPKHPHVKLKKLPISRDCLYQYSAFYTTIWYQRDFWEEITLGPL